MTILDKNVVIELSEEEKKAIEEVRLMINSIKFKMIDKHLSSLSGKYGDILHYEKIERYSEIFKRLSFESMLTINKD